MRWWLCAFLTSRFQLKSWLKVFHRACRSSAQGINHLCSGIRGIRSYRRKQFSDHWRQRYWHDRPLLWVWWSIGTIYAVFYFFLFLWIQSFAFSPLKLEMLNICVKIIVSISKCSLQSFFECVCHRNWILLDGTGKFTSCMADTRFSTHALVISRGL